MKLSGVHHIALNVDDVEKTTNFYVDVLGLEKVDRPDFGFPGSWLRLADGRQIHLVKAEDHKAPRGQHFALHVADLDEARQELTDQGFKVSEPMMIPGIGTRQAFLKDPSGNLIELNENPIDVFA
ncbi:MAG: VOC family protein [Acidimicrobiales bacterium]